MRYRQSNQSPSHGDQRAKTLINSEDALSTQEQEEVIAYFARSLRGSTQFLKVVVSLQAVLALVYTLLLLSGSQLVEISIDAAATESLRQLAQQRRAAPSVAAAETPFSALDTLGTLEKLDAAQRQAQRRYTHDYMNRRARMGPKSTDALVAVSAAVMLFSAALLLWAAGSGYQACRMLRVNVEDLVQMEPRDLRRRGGGDDSFRTSAQEPVRAVPAAAAAPLQQRAAAPRRLRHRLRNDPPAAQYAAAVLASFASFFWLSVILYRRGSLKRAYVELGLPQPSLAISLQNVTTSTLEYVLAVWQPLFHLGIGRLIQSMLDTRENLVALSRLKYRFEKV